MNWETWKQRAVRFDVGATALAGYDLGGGSATRTLTFCHGYPSLSLDIAPLAAILGSNWRVLTIDFPGFGASSPASSYSIHAAADAVEAWWTARSVGDTLLVAHDYGVSVAQELLARRRADHQLDVAVSGVLWMNGGLYPDLHRPTLGQQLLLDPEHGAEFAASITEATFADAIRATWGQRRHATTPNCATCLPHSPTETAFHGCTSCFTTSQIVASTRLGGALRSSSAICR